MGITAGIYETATPSAPSGTAQSELFNGSWGLLKSSGSSYNTADAEANQEMVDILRRRKKVKRKRGVATAETTKPESTTKSKTSNEEKTQSSENTSGSESSKQNATYSKDKVTFIFKDNSGNVIEGIDVVIQPHANEGSAHTDIAEVVGTSDKNGAVAWKPIEGKHLLEASKGSENQEYAVDIDVSDKGSVIELIWRF